MNRRPTLEDDATAAYAPRGLQPAFPQGGLQFTELFAAVLDPQWPSLSWSFV
jgi:hypothetical protein